MPFDLQDPNDLALFVALVGLGGTLVGALIGFLGTSITSGRQLDLQERSTRRAAYADHLGAVMEMQKFHRVARRFADEHGHAFKAALDYRVEQMNADDEDTRNEIGKAVAIHEQERDQAADRIRTHTEKFDEVHNSLLASAHRLKITGHPEVHEAAMALYVRLGGMVEMGHPDEVFGGIESSFHEALQVFSLLARADTKAPGEMSWRKARRQAHARLAALPKPLQWSDEGPEPATTA